MSCVAISLYIGRVQSGPSKGSSEPDLSLTCAWSEVRAWGSGHDEFFDHMRCDVSMLVCAYEFRARRTPGRWSTTRQKVSWRNFAPSRIHTNEALYWLVDNAVCSSQIRVGQARLTGEGFVVL